MIIYDAQTRAVTASLNLEVALGALQRTSPHALGTTNPGGRSSVSLTGDAEPVELVKSLGASQTRWLTSVETFAAESYDHSYNGQLRFGQIPFARVSGMGTATLSSEVPGHDVISEFYRNFRDYVTANIDSSTLIAEMFKHMANVASYGVPISFSQTTTSRMFIGPGISSTDSSEVQGIGVYFGGAAREGFCGEIAMPTGWAVTDLDEMMSESMEGLEDLPAGFGDIFDQSQPSEQPSEIPSWESLTQDAGSQPAAVTSPTERSSCVDGTSSNDLATNDLSQSVQLHLEALGYDPGNTTGDLSVITQIAISQFQADQEQPVTAEVSPQLLELLARAVDAGC